ncbi:MAG: cytochrome P450 [Actinobacteria bacterium]|nr:cytochrome P450 [Actinomycetota bacterium]
MTDGNFGKLGKDVVEGFSRYSCYTTEPDRAMELFEAARKGGCPVAHSDEFDGYFMLLGYDDVKKGMADTGLFSSTPQVLRPLVPKPPVPGLEMDPPQHKEWRQLFNTAVTPTSVGAMEPGVRADVDARIDNFIARGSADLVTELADTIPADTICRLVGVKDENVVEIREKAMAFMAAGADPDEFMRLLGEFAEVAIGEMHNREAEPQDDYLTYLTTIQVEGRDLGDDDYLGLVTSFLGAGHHSTTSAMSSLIYEVFRDPEVRDQLLADPETMIPVAIEEALRLHPPFYGFFRRATEDAEVAGVGIPEGSDVYMGWASANRDPEVFPEPTEFRLDRGRNRHLTFGFGVHTCPGAALARMELRVVVEQLLKRLPDLEIAVEEPKYVFQSGGDYAHIVTLPVTFEPRVGEQA